MAPLLTAALAFQKALDGPFDKKHGSGLEQGIGKSITDATATMMRLQDTTNNALAAPDSIGNLRLSRASLFIEVSRLNDQIRAGKDLPFSQDSVEHWVAGLFQCTWKIIVKADSFLHDLFGTHDVAVWITPDTACENLAYPEQAGVRKHNESRLIDTGTIRLITMKKGHMDRKAPVPQWGQPSTSTNLQWLSDDGREAGGLGQRVPLSVHDTHHLGGQHPERLSMATAYQPMVGPSPGPSRAPLRHSMGLLHPVHIRISGAAHGCMGTPELGAAQDLNNGGDCCEQPTSLPHHLQSPTFSHALFARAEITHGTLPTLVQYLLNCECRSKKEWFGFAFFLTFPLFCTPVELLDSLIDQFNLAQSIREGGDNRVLSRICQALKLWLETYWVPDTNHEVLERISFFVRESVHPVFPSSANLLLEITKGLRVSHCIPQTSVSPTLKQPSEQQCVGAQSFTLKVIEGNKSNRRRKPSMSDLSGPHLAHQITVKQMELLRAILPQEFLACRWMHGKAPNIAAMSRLTNNISNWVSATILSEPNAKVRGSIIGKWTQVAHQLFQLRNFDGLVAVVCGLTNTPVYRLHASWDAISSSDRESFHSLLTAVDPSQNYRALRGMAEHFPKPRLPFLGAYLTELVFIDSRFQPTKEFGTQLPGNTPLPTDCKVINWEKYARTAWAIKRILDSRDEFDIEPDLQVQAWIDNELYRLGSQGREDLEESLYQRSLALEPRTSNQGNKRSIKTLVSRAFLAR
ncbi:hypothetical protein CEP53_015077 [Fusarium sp. AF-6]|nr:hypothetical protein CEP53_015077 [Fusarium sp. AF-6]